jgi:transcriptional regulator with XRE-family HTH domain
MGFKENLRAELAYSGLMVKELAVLSGVKKYAIDNYLNAHNAMPAADTAVKIARSLGVTVEYLIDGGDAVQNKNTSIQKPNLRLLTQIFTELNELDQNTIVELAKVLKKRQGQENAVSEQQLKQ